PEVERPPAWHGHAALARPVKDRVDFVDPAPIERLDVVSAEPLLDVGQDGEERVAPGEPLPVQRQPGQAHGAPACRASRSRPHSHQATSATSRMPSTEPAAIVVKPLSNASRT